MSAFVDDLKKELVEGHVIVVVGSGVSLAVADRKGVSVDDSVAGWKGLLRHAIIYCNDLDPSDENWLPRKLKSLEAGDLGEMVALATEVEYRLKENEVFQNWLETTVGCIKISPQHKKLIDRLYELDAPLATTNYDKLLTDEREYEPITWKDDFAVSLLAGKKGKYVLHLHGVWDKADTVVLGAMSYADLLNRPEFKARLEGMAFNNSLLFIGCGLGLSDPHFKPFVDWYSKILGKNSKYRLFALVRDEEYKSRPKWLEHIIAIPYGKDYSDLPNFIAGLAPKPATSRLHLPSITTPNGPSTASPKIFDGLPKTGTSIFLGREHELDILNQAWLDNNKRVISLVGMGGLGKTELVRRFLLIMEGLAHGGAERIYAWSFYNQGYKRSDEASADDFINHALIWFSGSPVPDKLSIWEKVDLLAEQILLHPTLLILDGLEPLLETSQNSIGEFEGSLRKNNSTLLKLLELLASSRIERQLCVITSRFVISELGPRHDLTCPMHRLEGLGRTAGIQLLRKRGVQGEDAVLEEIYNYFDGHALCLNILGYFIKSSLNENAQRWKEVDFRNVKGLYERAEKVVDAIAQRLSAEQSQIMRLTGLFDRSAEGEAIESLLSERIDDLTNHVSHLKEMQWNSHVTYLRDCGLLLKINKDEHTRSLDAHPIVRAYFAGQIENGYPNAWKAGHLKLYHYFKNVPQKVLPETMDDIKPLYRAVSHGCLAGNHQQVFDEVYLLRILQGVTGAKRQVSWRNFAAFANEIVAVKSFFVEPWRDPHKSLNPKTQGIVLYAAGFCLVALGRVKEAENPLKKAFQEIKKYTAQENEDPEFAAICGGFLAQELPFLGKIEDAIEYARESVELADQSIQLAVKDSDPFQHIRQRCVLAHALHQHGEYEAALAIYVKADGFQAASHSEHKILHSLLNFLYCDLLLDISDQKREKNETTDADDLLVEIFDRTQENLKICIEKKWLLPIGLSYLALAQINCRRKEFSVAEENFSKAIEGLIKANRDDFLVRGLVENASFKRLHGKLNEAEIDLDKAREIATRGGMNLYLCDIKIEKCRMSIAQGDLDEAREHFKTAKEEVEKMKYGRRSPTLELLERELESAKSGKQKQSA